jgi:ABC-type lipoprotein release transport system permease subunit
MVVGEGARLAGAGLLIGVVVAALLARFLRGMLFEVGPTDPLTFAVISAGVLLVAGLATLLPALRAMGVDPAVALRGD